MTTATDAVHGQCFCGAVAFAVTPPTLFCAHCHCTMCRRLHGAAFVTWIGIPYDRFRLLRGDADLVRYRSSDHGTRSFCRHCGSTLFCESTHHPDWIDIVLANVEAPAGWLPDLQVFVDDGVPWADLASAHCRLGGTTGMEPR